MTHSPNKVLSHHRACDHLPILQVQAITRETGFSGVGIQATTGIDLVLFLAPCVHVTSGPITTDYYTCRCSARVVSFRNIRSLNSRRAYCATETVNSRSRLLKPQSTVLGETRPGSTKDSYSSAYQRSIRISRCFHPLHSGFPFGSALARVNICACCVPLASYT